MRRAFYIYRSALRILPFYGLVPDSVVRHTKVGTTGWVRVMKTQAERNKTYRERRRTDLLEGKVCPQCGDLPQWKGLRDDGTPMPNGGWSWVTGLEVWCLPRYTKARYDESAETILAALESGEAVILCLLCRADKRHELGAD